MLGEGLRIVDDSLVVSSMPWKPSGEYLQNNLGDPQVQYQNNLGDPLCTIKIIMETILAKLFFTQTV
jgi:hypothetical protein